MDALALEFDIDDGSTLYGVFFSFLTCPLGFLCSELIDVDALALEFDIDDGSTL